MTLHHLQPLGKSMHRNFWIFKWKKINLCNVYRLPRDHLKTFIEEFTTFMESFSKCHEIVIAGDFNIDLLQLQLFPLYSSLLPKITVPTRITRSSPTVIDKTMVKLTRLFQSSFACINAPFFRPSAVPILIKLEI